MKKLLVSIMILLCAHVITVQSQVRKDSPRRKDTIKRDDTIKRKDADKRVNASMLTGVALRADPSGVAQCGTNSQWIREVNQQMRRALSDRSRKDTDRRAAPKAGRPIISLPRTSSVLTTQPSFPVNQIITCGKFRLYYEDFLHANNDGFAHVGLGAARRNTMCAMLTYVESVYDFNQLPANDFIDLYFMQSYSATNPAPAGTSFLARAGPYFSLASGYGTTPGFYGGNMFVHVSTSVDPDPGNYDGVLQVNFDNVYSSSIFYQAVSYWNDYTDTTNACDWDLYSTLLHEVTHVMGWFSNVEEGAAPNYYAVNMQNNSFSLLDKDFLYYGDAKTPATFAGKKLVTILPPSINPNVSAIPNALRSNKVWMNNSGIPLNHAAYSGDFVGYKSTPEPPFAPRSLMSHLNDNLGSFTGMTQYSPGFQPNYVMGAGIAREQLKREWTNFEMRTLLNIGYQLNPAFANSKSLSGGAVLNQNLLTVNKPPHRTVPAQVTEYATWSNAQFSWAEIMPVTATISVNNNLTMPSTASTVVINVSSLGADADGDTVRVLPNSLFNIRGTGSSVPVFGGNNHNRLSVNSTATQVTFTPRPGFRGLAQFGFYLWDGKEKGSFVVATIDVQSVSAAYISTLPPTHNKVMNGGFEEGTEVRQRLLNESIEHTGFEFYREGPFVMGHHLSDNHPYNFMTGLGIYNGGEYVYQSRKDCNHINGGVKGDYGSGASDFNSNGYTFNFTPNPLANSATNPNHRYHNFFMDSFLELITPVTQCNYYRLDMDVSFQRSGLPVGFNLPASLNFDTSPGTTYTSTTFQTAPLSLPVTTVAQNAWQHFSTNVPYCQATPASFIRLKQNLSIPEPPKLDNVALSLIVPPPPLTVSATAAPASGSCCSTLSASASNTMCGATYTWQPGNLSGQSVTVCPTATTTYTVTVNDSCRTATSTVTVSPQGSGTTSWPKHPTGSVREFFTTTARAANDDLFAAGYFSDSVTFPGYPTWTAPTGRTLMVARFSDGCGTAWAERLGGSFTTVNDMVMDSSGNIFITGRITATTTFGSITLNGAGMFILKLDGSNGNVLAAKVSSGSGSAEGISLSIDAADNIYIGGQFHGSVNFGSSLPTHVSNASSLDIFAVKYDNLLAPQWSNSFGSPANDYNGGIAYSTSSLYVASNMNQNFAIGSTTFTNAAPGTTDMFIGRLDPATGAFLSGRMEGNSTDSCNVRDIAADSAGNVYFTGSYMGQFNVTTTALNATSRDIFIGRWTPGLVNSWAYSMGGGSVDEGGSISFDASGNVYFAGNFSGPATFAGFTPSTLTGGWNMFTVKVEQATGTRFFAAQSTVSGLSNARNYSITTLPGGQSYVAGTFVGTITFGTSAPQTSSPGSMDAIIGRLSNTGSFY
jgi:hypothetical protein